jgi:hypothetical protein
VDTLLCGHCGSRLPPWQAELYAAAARQLARTGGVRTDTANEGGIADDTRSDRDSDDSGDGEAPVEEGDVLEESPTEDEESSETDRTEDAPSDAEPVAGDLPPLTDDQVAAADEYVKAVGGREHAARALVESSVRVGDKEAVKTVLMETIRAASGILEPSEINTVVSKINEKVIHHNAREKGLRVVAV